jgi:hypothetical protein
MPGRYDPTLDAASPRHMAASPSSPRRRHAEPGGPPPQGYPAFPPGHPAYREHEEWERRGGDPRGPPGMPPHDPRGPSPRPHERGHPGDPRGPMGRSDSRDFQRPPDGFQRPPYGGPMGYPPPGADDHPRDARDMRFGFPEMHPDERMAHAGWDRNGRPPSIAREMPPDMRAPSPAASTSSRTSRRGGPTVKKEEDRRKPPAANKRMDPKGRGFRNGDEPSPRPSPAPSHASSGPRGMPQPNRMIDEGE